jgi:2-polyprenyl-3-methyl-5-hydroxy-6-metoxy-1,4-benzoquinol methylase
MQTEGSNIQNSAHAWYESNAASFTETDVIELPFIGKDSRYQERLNRFKLWAIDQVAAVDFAGKHVLDYGAGHGRLALAYPTAASYLGVDYSANLIALGQKRLKNAGLGERAKLVVGDVNKWQGPREQFDIVCSLGMFCYLPDPGATLKAMAAHVKPGGLLFMDFRSSSPLWDLVRKVKWKLHPPTGGHTRAWKGSETVRMMREAGLVDCRIVMREYPLLGHLYASRGREWPLKLRNAMAAHHALDLFATEAWAFARKPVRN